MDIQADNGDHYELECLSEVLPTNSEITCCVFDTNGRRLACAFGDHRVLVFTSKSDNDSLRDWKTSVYTVFTKAAIIHLDWNEDGSLIAAGDFHNMFYIFSTVDGVLAYFSQLSSNLSNIKWNKKGASHHFLTSGDDGRITLWNQSKERVLIDQNYSFHSGGVRGLEWLTKQTFASCSMDGSIHVCQTDRHEPLHSLFQEQAVLSIHFNVKYDYIAFFSYDLNVKVWKLGEDTVREWTGHRGGIYSLAWNTSDDFSQLASGSDDKTVRVWSIHNVLCERVLEGQLSGLVSAVSFSPNGRYLAAADTNGVYVIWSTKSWSLLLRKQCESTILDSKSLKWNPTSTQLIIASQSTKLVVIEMSATTDKIIQ